MSSTPRRPVPLWLAALGGVGVAAIAAALAYALFVAAHNFARIGV
jgi:alkanesulfonate monooxygenase SsuD/methylene tetrahydromethanopterin reductase-like flavin-dependent oxidoreductase (luciferase family)